MARALVGIMGLKRSGKDTYAARLVAEHGFTRYALADPMREFALALDPLVRIYDHTIPLSQVIANIGWERAKEQSPDVRRTLQRLGTEAGRDVIGEDFWISVTDRLVQANPGCVVITDIRFPNEYAYIRDQGGHLVRVIRPGQEDADVHISERMATDLDGYPADCTVYNAGTIADLHEHADLVARVLCGSTTPRQDTLF